MLDTTFYQIAYFARPQGQLLNDLNKAVNDMDAELPTVEVVTKGKAFLEKLVATPKEKLAEDLYFVDTLVSAKMRSSLKNVQEHFADVYKEATEAIQGGNYERSAVRLLYAFYEAYFYNDMQEDLNALLSKALREAGGQPMEQASGILYKAMDRIMDGELDEDEDGEDFLAGLSDLMGKDMGQLAREQLAAQQMADQANEALQQAQQQMYAAMGGDDMQQLQQRMAEAMMKGDMAEYARLMGEFQQKMMGNLGM